MQQAGPDEQAQHLEESLQFIRQQDAQMRKCLEQKGKLLDAIRHASTFLAELRSSALSPKQYYELYIAVFDALSFLGAYLRDDHQNHHLGDIYELVQYAGNIVPRLYLMITVGCAYMSVPDAPLQEIMRDMMEMCRGVQHPIRGLFLRYYLSQGVRDHLPIGSTPGPGGNLKDSVQFILTNFIEMNKLWVRLQHQGHSRERDRRTQERQELQILVGSNLVRLSQLEGIDKDYYRSAILPAILEQVVQCRDVLAQEYLLDVICQVFPDDFQLYTLDLFLSATSNLNPRVSIRRILLALISRLTDYAARQKEEASSPDDFEKSLSSALREVKLAAEAEAQSKADSPETDQPKSTDDAESEEAADGTSDKQNESDAEPAESEELDHDEQPAEEDTNGKDTATISANLFERFWKHFTELLQVRPDLPMQDRTALLAGICKLSLNWYPDNLEYVDRILKFVSSTTQESPRDAEDSTKEANSNVLDLLQSLVKYFPNFLTVLSIPGYLPLLQSQPIETQRDISSTVLETVLKANTFITKLEDVEGIFSLLDILIKPTPVARSNTLPGGPSTGRLAGSGLLGPDYAKEGVEGDSYDETAEIFQSKIARAVHLVYNREPDAHAKLLVAAKRALSHGGALIKFTYPSLVTSAFKLVRRYNKTLGGTEEGDASVREKMSSALKFIHRVVDELYRAGSAELALRLYVNAASIADQAGSEEASYEFFAEAFTVYEEQISDSRAQFQAVCIIAGTLQNTRNFSSDNYDTLVSKCALYGSKLLKKSDQCRAVYLASHLWWVVDATDEQEEQAVFRDDKRVLECLQRALRVADACMDVAVSVELFVEILNRYLYYFDHGNTAVTVRYINGLIDLIQRNLANNVDDKISDSPRKHFERTLEYITQQQEADEKFQQIVWS